MLPSSCSHRLLALLNCALEKCVDENRLVELQLRYCHRLLKPWKSPSLEEAQQIVGGTSEQDKKSTAEEQQELAMVNRALEKAMRIRNTIPAPLPGVHEKAKVVPERKSSSVAMMVRCPSPSLKEKDGKTAIRVPSARTIATKKHGYTLHPPYRTNPERKRNLGVSAVTKVQQSSNRKPDLLQTEGVCLHTKDCQPSEKSLDQLLGVPELDVLGDTHRDLSENQILSDTTGSSREQTITFKEIGPTLKLPLPYRQSSARNERLWEKVLFWQSKSPDDSENQFIKKMESDFDTGTKGFSPATVGAELTVLGNAHAILREHVDGQRFLKNTGTPTWEEEYRELLLLEALQDTIYPHLRRLQELREGELMHQSYILWQRSRPETAKSSLKMDSEGLVGSSSGLDKWRFHDMNSLSRPLLVYSSAHELKEMASQKLHIGRLQQQLHIQKVLMSELLPLLESKKLTEPTLALPFRAIYTQLCEGGQRFPALVFDDLPD